MKAERLKQVDLDYRCHMLAYLTKCAGAEKQSGTKGKTKPVYDRFKKFYDYEKEIKKVLKQDEENKPSDRLKKISEYRKARKE